MTEKRIGRSLIERSGPDLIGFFSYSREDDADSRGALSGLRDRIQGELRAQLGRSARDFRLWQDREGIAPGTLWEAEIRAAVAQSAFFIMIVTPTTTLSEFCRFEFEAFRAREQAIGRHDLIFPILYIRVSALEDTVRRAAEPLLSMIAQRQYVDWQKFRFRDVFSPEFSEAIAQWCADIVAALSRPYETEAEQAVRLAEDRRKAEETTRLAEAKREAEEAARFAEDERKAEETRRLAEVKRKADEVVRLAEEKRKAEEDRKAEETTRLAEEKRKAEEIVRLAEQNRKAEEVARLAEEERKAEDTRRLAEEKRTAEEVARLAEEKRKAEEARRQGQRERVQMERDKAHLAEDKRNEYESVRRAEEKRKAKEARRQSQLEREEMERDRARLGEKKRRDDEAAQRVEEARQAREAARLAAERRKVPERKAPGLLRSIWYFVTHEHPEVAVAVLALSFLLGLGAIRTLRFPAWMSAGTATPAISASPIQQRRPNH